MFPRFFISVLNGPTLLCLSREANEISSSDHEHLFDVTNDVSRGLPCAIAVIAYRRMSVINVTSPKERTRIPLFFPKKEKRKKTGPLTSATWPWGREPEGASSQT